MSYQRTLTSSVQWHTSGSVHYPASESGGSVSYSDSGSIPVTITVHVDTTPFDASVAGCNAEVAALGASVVAMNTAQCAAIQNTRDTVSSHITGGFFSLVKSELSQNMAALFARLNSQILLVMEKTKSAVRQRQVMQGDYERAEARYAKVFADLDEECKRRVAEVDKAACNLSASYKRQSGEQTQSSAASITYMNDGTAAQSMLFGAYIKSKVDIIIEEIARRVAGQASYMAQMKSILRDDAADKRGEYFVPVLYAQCLNIEDKARTDEMCYASEAGAAEVVDNGIITDAIKRFASSNDAWCTAAAGEKESIAKAFNALSEAYISTDADGAAGAGDGGRKRRVYDTMMALFGQDTASS